MRTTAPCLSWMVDGTAFSMRLHTITTPQIATHEAGHAAAMIVLTGGVEGLEVVANMAGGHCRFKSANPVRRVHRKAPPPHSRAAAVAWGCYMAPLYASGAASPSRSDVSRAGSRKKYLPCGIDPARLALKNLMDDGYVRFFVARCSMLLQSNGKATSAELERLIFDAGIVDAKRWALADRFHSECNKTKEA